MIYKKKTLDSNNKRIIGWCDGCECDLYPGDPHWLVLLPNERKITALCKKCRDWMLTSLDLEDHWTDEGMYEFRHGKKMTLIDKVERWTLTEQLDDDEQIVNEEDDEV